MATLARETRRELERCVKRARRAAETGARKAVERLGVGEVKAPAGLTPAEQSLRLRLRAHGRQLGDRRDQRRETQTIGRLTTECAYEHWHRMLFARFLAENELLIEPELGVAISLSECEELAREQGQDWLPLASSFAVRMLKQIFRAGDPVLDVSLPPEARSELEDLLKGLPREVFLADDSLGWVYQFWQADRKDEVTASEVKIGADELPAVTQLFTEDYMVLFLLHNTLGAWWAGRVLAAEPRLATTAEGEDELRAACAVGDVAWTYLRFVRDGEGPWQPAAGIFDGWPKAAREITVLDPCMGSGHFLVFALPILVAFRMAEEGLSREAAVDAVLRDNLFGLEIDPRCTQIAAFNLALTAWKLVGYRPLPSLQLACSGLTLGVGKEEWVRLAEKASPIPPEKDLFGKRENLFSDRVRAGFEQLYDLFQKGPWLGSLINPRAGGGNMYVAGFKEVEPLLTPLLAGRTSADVAEMAVTAQGLAKAAELLARTFTLVTTNVPYLGRGKQDDALKEYCEKNYFDGKAELATCFVERCMRYCGDSGTSALVTPQNWLFLTVYSRFRKKGLSNDAWCFVAKLGPAAFQGMNWWAANTALLVISRATPSPGHVLSGIDFAGHRVTEEKPSLLQTTVCRRILQSSQRDEPESRVTLDMLESGKRLSDFADVYVGLQPGDTGRLVRYFWETTSFVGYGFMSSSPNVTSLFDGNAEVIVEPSRFGELGIEGAVIRGREAWGK